MGKYEELHDNFVIRQVTSINRSTRFADIAWSVYPATTRYYWRYCVHATEAAHAYVSSTPLPGLPAEGEEPADSNPLDDGDSAT